MLVNLDAKQLEWLCAIYLSKDKVGYDEIRSGADSHSLNQERFGLPTRLVAKTFLFRLIYGGSAYAYANDPDFTHVSRSQRFWQQVIDETYDKYRGLSRWHSSLMKEASQTGHVRTVTGRVYPIPREYGEIPRPKALNYPVQGLGADLMAIARVSLFKRVREDAHIKIVSTVHDSILLDAPKNQVDKICTISKEVFNDVPRNFTRLFNVEFDLPFGVEIKAGPNWGEIHSHME